MAYCTLADLTDRYGEQEIIERTDRVNIPPETVDTDVLDQAIADADAEINAALAVRYALPLANVPAILVRWACSITRFLLMVDLPSDHPIVQEYERVRRSLAQVAAGNLSIGPDTTGATPPAGGTVQFETGTREFARSEAW